jgi:hypothetical protein
MAEVSVPLMAFQRQQLPLVCVKTGRVADRMVTVHASSAPAWTWWLLPLGPVLLLLARWFWRRQVTGWVPMCRSAAARLERVRWFGCGGLYVAVVSLFLGRLASSPCLARLGVTALAAGVAAALVEPIWLVGARLDRPGNRVVLTRVHPAFRAAAADTGGLLGGRRHRHGQIRRATEDGG